MHSMPPNDPLTVFWWGFMVFLVSIMILAMITAAL